MLFAAQPPLWENNICYSIIIIFTHTNRHRAILRIETSNIDLFYCDDFINEVGSYKVTLKVPNVPYDIIDKGKYLVTWKIHPDGSLKIKLETWNNDESQR